MTDARRADSTGGASLDDEKQTAAPPVMQRTLIKRNFG
jgi:hypothetical protein